MSTTTTLVQELLLQCEEDSFIPDEMDDKLYNDHTYNWEVMFETVKFFIMKEGRWPRGKGRGQARCDYGRWLNGDEGLGSVDERSKTKQIQGEIA